jgi:hypothetical protein
MVIVGNRMWNEMFAPNWMRDRISVSMTFLPMSDGGDTRPGLPGNPPVAGRRMAGGVKFRRIPCIAIAGARTDTPRPTRRRAYPTEFVKALTEAGYLAALIPEEYGGSGLSLKAAAVILEEVHARGGNSAACHAQMYIMGTILRHGSDEQKAATTCPASRRANCGCRPSA